MGQAGEVIRHGGDKRINDLIFYHVGDIAVGFGARIAAHLVGDGLVLGEGVGHQGKQSDIVFQSLSDSLARRFAPAAILIRHSVQRLAKGHVPTVQ